MSSIAVNAITDASAGNTATINSVTPNVNNVVGKNRIIGGDFTTNPWQRGTSFAALASSGYSADRWVNFYTSTAVVTASKVADAPTAAQAGVFTQDCLSLAVTTADTSIAAGDNWRLAQNIEGLNASSFGFGQAGSRNVTLSFWVKGTKTGIHCVALRNGGNNRSYVAEYTIVTTNTWEYKTITIPVDTTGTWLYDTANGLSVFFTLMSGTTFQTTADTWTAGNFFATANQVNALDSTANTFKIALVQLEAGSSATEFEHRQYGTELSLCQRYYFRTGATAGYATLAMGYLNTNTVCNIVFQFPVAMRAFPSGSFSGCRIRYQGGNGTTSATTGVSANTTSCEFKLSTSSIPTGYPVALQTNANASDHVAFSAEL